MELFCASSNPCVKQLVLGLSLQISSGHLGSRSLRSTSSYRHCFLVCLCLVRKKSYITATSDFGFLCVISIRHPSHIWPSHKWRCEQDWEKEKLLTNQEALPVAVLRPCMDDSTGAVDQSTWTINHHNSPQWRAMHPPTGVTSCHPRQRLWNPNREAPPEGFLFPQNPRSKGFLVGLGTQWCPGLSSSCCPSGRRPCRGSASQTTCPDE